MRHALKCHPDTPCEAVTRIDVQFWRRSGTLLLDYVATGTIADLRLPPASPPARTDELWKHTCFEAFLRSPPGDGYDEFNLSPSTQWAAYRFDSYRSAMTPLTATDAPRIEIVATTTTFNLHATLALERWKDTPWHLGLSAVIEETSGRKSYWALAHPPGKPDFHHADCFALQIPAASRL